MSNGSKPPDFAEDVANSVEGRSRFDVDAEAEP
jgi:hypothetical protein